jgi:hypothetical protein
LSCDTIELQLHFAINKHHIFDHKSHVFVFDHDGIFLQKTGLDIWGHQDTRFLLVDYQTIFCADFKYDSNYFLC